VILKSPELLSVGIKAERGLFHKADAYALRADTIAAFTAFFERTQLAAGQETPVAVASELPPNANVRAVSATLSAGRALSPPAPPATGVSVVRGDEPAIGFELSTTPAPWPSNVTVRLDGGEVFWSQSGPLAGGDHELPDFAEQLNAYLDRLDSDGSVPVTFLVRSDTPGSASIALKGLEYTRLQTQTWPNPLDDTLRVDRNFDAGFGTEVRLPLDPLHGDGSPRLTSVRLDVGGQLGSERLFGELTPSDGRDLGTISAEYSLAQPLKLATSLSAVGVNLRLLAAAAAEVYAELAPDAGGAPAAGRALAQGKLALAPPEDASAPAWQYLAFESGAQLERDVAYWVVLRSVSGQALIALDAADAGHALVNRGGEQWAALGAVALSLLVVYEPGVDNRSAALGLGLEGAKEARVDPAGAAASVALEVEGAASPPVLVVRSYARGTVSLANVVEEFHS
jgi:hypothetical protein